MPIYTENKYVLRQGGVVKKSCPGREMMERGGGTGGRPCFDFLAAGGGVPARRQGTPGWPCRIRAGRRADSQGSTGLPASGSAP